MPQFAQLLGTVVSYVTAFPMVERLTCESRRLKGLVQVISDRSKVGWVIRSTG